MYRNESMNQSSLTSILATTLSDVVVMYFKAHGHHWNVTGPDFAQFHSFFSEIYEDVYGSIDPMAENMRKLGANAPYRLQEFAMMATIADAEVGNNAQAMLADLMDANEGVLSSLNNAFEEATNENEQGIANFIAERLDQHEKWRWQISAFLAPQSSTMPGKSEAAQLFEAEADASVDAQHMDESEIAEAASAWCARCSEGTCYCTVNGCSCNRHCRCAECMGQHDGIVTAAGSRPAPKKDRIHGSKTNPKGSAAGGKVVKFSEKVETALHNKVTEHNKTASEGRKATISQLKAVYRRGAGAFSSSHRPGKTRDQWAMARVNAYLHLLKSGSPSNPKYVQDNDLLPKAHPRSMASDTITAAAYLKEDLTIVLKEENEYDSSEDAIVALAEYSGLGYDVIPSLRASWRRAAAENENAFDRAKELALNLYSSRDCDLLPLRTTKE